MVGHLIIPDETLAALKLNPETAVREMVLLAAIKLFEVGQLSAGAAALLAGLPTPVFITRLAAYGVPVFKLTEAETARDAQNA
jgi:predicted HTH domain antitoxin